MKIISVKVKPGARVSTLAEPQPGQWHAQLKSPPVDGKANAELVLLIARHFGCARSAVSIRSGASSRTKRVAIDVGPERNHAGSTGDPSPLAGKMK